MNSYIILALAMVGGLVIAIASNLDPTLGASSSNYNTGNYQKVGGRKSRKQQKHGKKSRKSRKYL